MNISSSLNTVSSSYGQQKGNQMKTPASGEKTFYTAETPKVYQIFTTDMPLFNKEFSRTEFDRKVRENAEPKSRK